MIIELQCPSCKSDAPKILGNDHYECTSCGTHYVIKGFKQQKQSSSYNFNDQMQESMRSARKLSRIITFTVLLFVLLGFGFGIYMAVRTTNMVEQQLERSNDLIKDLPK